jgi:hypothetical protein
MATNGDDISIHTTMEMEKYEFLHHREFAHTCVYDVNLLERDGLDVSEQELEPNCRFG